MDQNFVKDMGESMPVSKKNKPQEYDDDIGFDGMDLDNLRDVDDEENDWADD